MTIALIDYGAGNLHSAAKAFEHAIAASNVRETVAVTSDPDVVDPVRLLPNPGML